MEKLFLMSALIALVAWPLLAARDRSPVRGMKKVLILIVLSNFAYGLAISRAMQRLEGKLSQVLVRSP